MTHDEPAFRPSDLLGHRPWVRALARSLVRDPALADDLEQDTWVRALTRAPTAVGSPRAWLATVMRNRLRDLRRGEVRRATREERVARDAHPPGPAELAAEADTHRHLIECVLDLEPLHRDAILLRYFEGLAPAEAAERLDVPASTVRSRTQRGLAQLRERLDAEHGSDDRAWRLALAPLLAGGAAERTARRAATTSLLGGSAWLPWAAAAALAVLGWYLATPGDGGSPDGTDATDVADVEGASSDRDGARLARGRRRNGDGSRSGSSGGVSTAVADDAGGGMAPIAGDDADADAGGEAAPALPDALVVEVARADGTAADAVDVELLEIDGSRPFGPQRRVAGAATGDDGRADLGRPDGLYARAFALEGDQAAVGEIVNVRERPRVRLVLGPARRLRVLVLGPDGEAVGDARLALDLTGRGSAGLALSARTDPNGRAAFRPLPRAAFDGRTTLQVEAPGYVSAYRGVSLREVESGSIEIALERGHVVRGRCVGAGGKPVADVRVSCIYADRAVFTGADGRFELTGIDRAEVDVRFEHDALAPRSVRTDRDRAPGGALGDVELRAGTPLRVRVVGDDGAAAPGVKVRVLSRAIGRGVRRGVTGADGRVTLEHLGAGLHDVLVSRDGEDLDWAAGLEGATRDVVVGGAESDGAEVRVTIGARQSVLLTYVDTQGAERTTDHVFVKWSPVGHDGPGHTWSIGGRPMRATRFRPAAPGRYRLTIVVEGCVPLEFDDVEVAGDVETRLQVELKEE